MEESCNTVSSRKLAELHAGHVEEESLLLEEGTCLDLCMSFFLLVRLLKRSIRADEMQILFLQAYALSMKESSQSGMLVGGCSPVPNVDMP